MTKRRTKRIMRCNITKGDSIVILNDDDPRRAWYGEVESVDLSGYLHGTWGDWKVIPGHHKFRRVFDCMEMPKYGYWAETWIPGENHRFEVGDVLGYLSFTLKDENEMGEVKGVRWDNDCNDWVYLVKHQGENIEWPESQLVFEKAYKKNIEQ